MVIHLNNLINAVVNDIFYFWLGSPTKKPEIVSILKHKNDITLTSQLYNGKYKMLV